MAPVAKITRLPRIVKVAKTVRIAEMAIYTKEHYCKKAKNVEMAKNA